VYHPDCVCSTKAAGTIFRHAHITNWFYQGFPQKIDFLISSSSPDARFLDMQEPGCIQVHEQAWSAAACRKLAPSKEFVSKPCNILGF
jgi:hypothetical protein